MRAYDEYNNYDSDFTLDFTLKCFNRNRNHHRKEGFLKIQDVHPH